MKKSFFVIALCLIFKVYAQNRLIRLSNYKLEHNAQYGWSCATNGDFVTAGGHDASYTSRGKKVKSGGKVVVYRPFNNKWIKYQELENPAMDNYGWFGNNLAMNADFLIVAASGFSQNEIDNHEHREGKVYIYKLGENQYWQKRLEIGAPTKNRNGEFGKSMCLKGDTLAVFYESGDDYYEYPNQQCIAFYKLNELSDKPFRVACFPKSEVPIFRFHFDFNESHLIIGRKCHLTVYKFEEGNQLDSLCSENICDQTSIDGNLTSLRIHNEQVLAGFHESMYYFWGYEPVGSIMDGDSVIGKTILNKASGKYESYILPKDTEVLNQYGVTTEFFKEHARVYESLEARAKRIAGAGVVRVYSIDDEQLEFNQRIVPSTRHLEDWFGSSMVVYGNNLLVSALGYPDISENFKDYQHRFAGAVFHFKRNESGQWVEQEIYRSKHAKRWDKFGFSLNNWKSAFVLGCRFDEYENQEEDTEQGAVYLMNF